MSSGRGKTATEVEALQMQGSNVIDDISRAFNENFFRPLVQKITLLTYKYKVSARFIDIDRKKRLNQKIVINVGIGSINKMLEIDNIDKSIMSITQLLQFAIQLQDNRRIEKYMQMFDDMNMQKLKLLGQDSIIEKSEEAEEQQQEEEKNMQQQQMMQQQQQGEAQ